MFEAVVQLGRDVDAIGHALGRVAKARAADDPVAWREAAQQVEHRLAAASVEHEQAREQLASATPEVRNGFEVTAIALSHYRDAAARLGDAPRGWTEVSHEAPILAAVRAPVVGDAQHGFAEKERAIGAALAQLDATESRALAKRLRRPAKDDALAQAFARMTAKRRERLLAFLDGARRRDAVAAERAPRPALVQHDAGAAPLVSRRDGPVLDLTRGSPGLGESAPLVSHAAADAAPVSAPILAAILPRPAPLIEPRQEAPGVAHNDAVRLVDGAQEVLVATRDNLIPGFQAAVSALDDAAAMQLAQLVVRGVHGVLEGRAQLHDRLRAADPAARQVTRPGDSLGAAATVVSPSEHDGFAALQARVTGFSNVALMFYLRAAIDVSPQLFRGVVVASGVQSPAGARHDPLGTILREASTTVDLVKLVGEIRELLGPVAALAPVAPLHQKQVARAKLHAWKSRPIDFQFLKRVLTAEGLWPALAEESSESGRALLSADARVSAQASATGSLESTGAWDPDVARTTLTRGATDWAITDDDAQKVLSMITSASPAARGALVLQLQRMGKLGRMCDNLPWRAVQQLHDAVPDVRAKAALQPYFEGKGGGESMSQFYERRAMASIQDDHLVRGFGWTYLQAAHSMMTAGFLERHDAGYEAEQAGVISGDAYLSNTGKAAGRAAVLLAASAVTGGAAGAAGEGFALGTGMVGRTGAQIAGGALGGVASGVTEQFAGDVYDIALDGKQGFSSPGDYLRAGAQGGAFGGLMAGIMPAAIKYLPARAQARMAASADRMGREYAKRFPGLDNVLTRIRNAGARQGMITMSGTELSMLMHAGLASELPAAMARLDVVMRNRRIDIGSRTLSKVHPQSEIQSFYGVPDPATGRVRVDNPTPTTRGYVADADSIPASARGSDAGVREALGVDIEQNDWYAKYFEKGDPLFEVRFRVSVEPDVPLPQFEAPEVRPGQTSPKSHHVAGSGHTQGGVPEAIMPAYTPIDIIEILPIGTPRQSYPTRGEALLPPVTNPPKVRNIEAPIAGASSGAAVDSRKEEE